MSMNQELARPVVSLVSSQGIAAMRPSSPFSSFSLNLSTDTRFSARITICFSCPVSNLSHPDVALMFLRVFNDFQRIPNMPYLVSQI